MQNTVMGDQADSTELCHVEYTNTYSAEFMTCTLTLILHLHVRWPTIEPEWASEFLRYTPQCLKFFPLNLMKPPEKW